MFAKPKLTQDELFHADAVESLLTLRASFCSPDQKQYAWEQQAVIYSARFSMADQWFMSTQVQQA